MSLADDPMTRAGWIARAVFLDRAISDLRAEVTIAVQQQPAPPIVALLLESDVHLEWAQNEIRTAIDRIAQIT